MTTTIPTPPEHQAVRAFVEKALMKNIRTDTKGVFSAFGYQLLNEYGRRPDNHKLWDVPPGTILLRTATGKKTPPGGLVRVVGVKEGTLLSFERLFRADRADLYKMARTGKAYLSDVRPLSQSERVQLEPLLAKWAPVRDAIIAKDAEDKGRARLDAQRKRRQAERAETEDKPAGTPATPIMLPYYQQSVLVLKGLADRLARIEVLLAQALTQMGVEVSENDQDTDVEVQRALGILHEITKQNPIAPRDVASGED